MVCSAGADLLRPQTSEQPNLSCSESIQFALHKTLMSTRSNHRKRVLSGMRSTGKLHLGNFVGALDNWVRMQEQYECFFFVADWHALTTDYADTSRIKQNSVEVLLDWLAAGLDPEKCVMFIQSHVPAHA